MKAMWTKTEITEYTSNDLDVLEDFNAVGTAQYTDSVYDVGVIEPIILAKYRNKLSLVAGNRRVLSYIAAVDRAISNDELDDRPWLHSIHAKIYHGLKPNNQVAISLIENEERSENTVLTFMQIQRLKDEGKWDEVADLIRINKGRLAHFKRLQNVEQEFLDAHTDGKIAKGNLLKIASLNKTRQGVLKRTLAQKGKITAPDIREAKSTQVTNALRKMPALPAIPVPQVEGTKRIAPPMYVVLKWDESGNKPGLQPVLAIDMTLIEAQNKCHNGDRIFKLVEV